jgi:hypothetical protein
MNTQLRIRMTMTTILLVAGLAASTSAEAMLHRATATDCPMKVSDLVWKGQRLSYEKVAHIGASYVSVTGSGTVYTSLLPLGDGRESHFAVEKNGCARMISNRDFFAEPLRRSRGAGLR